MLACDVVIKSPGISRYRPEVAQLEEAGVPVRSGLGLWLEDVPLERVTCITGTKGKSTTTAIAGHLLNRLGYDARVGGNIGQPPWEPSSAGEPDYWVIETSSYQVPDLTNGPPVVAVTSLSPDHLDWHGSVERYYADKLALCTKPGVRTAIADGSSATLRGACRRPGAPRAMGGRRRPRVSAVRGYGPSACRASTTCATPPWHVPCCGRLGVVEAEDDDSDGGGRRRVPGTAQPMPLHRPRRRVEFVDDGLSTNVLPAQAALEAYGDRPVALLVGGHDRGLDYAPLGQAVARRTVPTLVVTMPDNGPRIGSAIREVVGDAVEVIDAAGLGEAVAIAWGWARSAGDETGTVPSCCCRRPHPASARYTDYRDRARAFAEAAAACGPLT